MKINDKSLIQSYILTSARYDFSVYEKRILYRIIELLQDYTSGIKLNQKYSIQKSIFDDVDIVMPITAFLKDENDNNYHMAKKALTDLENKKIEYEDDKMWAIFRLIERPIINRYDSLVSLRISPIIAKAFLDFSKGFSKYQLEMAMSFESIYSMRFYELLSGQSHAITYTIDNLKLMFKIQDKYDRVNDFIKYVIQPAKKELDKKSPIGFEYKTNKIGRSIHSISFHPYRIKGNENVEFEKSEVAKQVSLRWDLDKLVLQYLKENYIFSDQEIRNNLELFKQAHGEMDLLLFLSNQKTNASKKTNPKGWIINAIKKQLEQKKNPSQGKKTDSGRASKTQSVEDVLKGLNL
jgi:plasmid replication initiation protein